MRESIKVELYHEPCLQWLKDQPSKCVAGVISDPPYHLQGKDDLTPMLNDVLRECLRVSRGPVIWIMPICWQEPLERPFEWRRPAKFNPLPDSAGFWHTSMMAPPKYEPVCGTAPVLVWRGPYLGEWAINLPSEVSAAGGRSARKPVGLYMRLMNYLPTGTVLDPFMGEGTVCDAAAHKGRDAIGVENNRAVFESARKRILPDSKEIKSTRDGSPGSWAEGVVSVAVAN